MTERKGRRLLSGKQTVFSIRDTGYKSTDYAVSELLDNSVQAESDTVLLVLVTEPTTGGERRVQNVTEIVVIDDGNGMNHDLLFNCLAFGESGRFGDRKGIGRFGMGLSQASVSQGRRTDVWSYQDTQPTEAGHVYLDLDEMEKATNDDLVDVYEPTYPSDEHHVDLPDWVATLYATAGMRSHKVDGLDVRSGTVVRWTNLDRLRWVRASAIMDHSERTIGRIYRRFLTGAAHKTNIRIGVVERTELTDKGAAAIDFRNIRPNDPMFLLRPCDTTLEYWERDPVAADGTDKRIKVRHVPMFRPYPKATQRLPSAVADAADTEVIEATTTKFPVTARPDAKKSPFHGRKFEVEVRVSFARIDAQPGRNAGGNTYQGKHARDNAGISMMRSDRELSMESTLATEATDRWWGIEVSFTPELDEVFGVTNNKQDVPYFTQALKFAHDHLNTTVAEAVDEGLFDETHPIHDLWPIAQFVLQRRNAMNGERKKNKETKNNNTTKNQPGIVAGVSKVKTNSPDVLPPGPGEKKFEAEHPDPADQSNVIRDEFKQKHGDDFTDDEIDAIVALREAHFVVQVHEKHVPETSAMFWPEELGDLNIAWINTGHPAHERLLMPLRVTDDQLNAMSLDDLRKLAALGANAVGMLILMWCQMEIEDSTGRFTFKEARERWGQFTKNVLAEQEFEDADVLATSTFGDEDD